MAETQKSRVLTLRICTPDGVTDTLECDSVCFSIPDGVNGTGGGRIGIRPGHIASLIAVAPGRLAVTYSSTRLSTRACNSSGVRSLKAAPWRRRAFSG